jgi:drug/metabolite transporter (DMT)-like permease
VSTLAVGLLLALAASLALNGAFLLQHAGLAGAPDISPGRPLRSLASLMASRVWAVGLALGLSGWALHVVALTRAPLSLVQAFVAGGLALTVPAARRWLREPGTRREAVAVAVMALALAALASGASGGAGGSHYSRAALGAWCVGSVLIAGLAAAAPAGRRRAEALGLAGGVLYGAADAAIKALTGTWSAGGPAAVLRSPWLAVAAVTTAGAFFCFQRGLQLGRAVPVIALMTAGTYLVSILAGVLVFHDPLGHGVLGVPEHALAFAAVVGAAWVLAPAQTGLAASARKRLRRRSMLPA